ncbi:MAG TPA: SIMPL domain-containing protein [Vicinamibacterales bacterium]|nr:SIMPL domain-containing protein [Vicinamibacterales bacterium]
MKLTLAVVFLITAALPVAAQPQPQPPGPPPAVIVTSGEAVVKRAPDRAWVTVGAESRAKTAREAQLANADAMTAVIERIKGAGIPADAIQTTGYNLQPEFDYANGKQTLRGYVARNQVQVRVDAMAKTGDVITAVVASGATTVSGVRFDLKERDTAEREALRLAVQDARRRADYAATGAGVAIERVIRVEEQRDMGDVVRPMRMDMAMMKAEAGQAVPLEAGEIEIRSRVTLTVAIR